MATSTSKEASRKMASLQLGSDFERIMPHYQSEASLLDEDLMAAKQSLTQAYSSDVFFMKSIDEMTGYASYTYNMNSITSGVEDSTSDILNSPSVPMLPKLERCSQLSRMP